MTYLFIEVKKMMFYLDIMKLAPNINLKTIIRTNADCPFLDKGIIKKMIKIFKKRKYDYFLIY